MENNADSTIESVTIIEIDSDLDKNFVSYTSTKDITLSCNVSPNNSVESQDTTHTDQFEDIIYQVNQNDSKTVITFRSRPIFSIFVEKMKADFALSITDNLSFTTHVNSLKCHVSIDFYGAMVIATGVGHKEWKSRKFVKVAKDLLKRFFLNNNESQDDTNSSEYSCNNDSITHGINLLGPVFTSTPLTTRTYGSSIIHKDVQVLIDAIKTLQEQMQHLTQEVIKVIDQRSATPQTPAQSQTVPSSLPTDNADLLITDQNEPNESSLTPVTQTETQYVANTINNHNPNHMTYADSASITSPNQNTPVIVNQQNSGASCGGNKTLLIGSSILHGVNPKGLNKGVFKHAKSGAGIEEITEEINYFDISKFNKIIVYVGGNNVNKMSGECFHQKYSALVDKIKTNAPRSEILLCELVPRADVDVTEFNMLIYDVATNSNLSCIELYTAFLKQGYQLDRYYSKDGIHLSFSGIKRLLGGINKDVAIVADFNRCTY